MRSAVTIPLPRKLLDVIPLKAVSDLSVSVFRTKHQFKPLAGDGTLTIFMWPCRRPYD